MRRTVIAALGVALLLPACTPAGEAAARRTGESFQAALHNSDATTACALLSDEARHNLESVSGRACAQALTGLRLPTGGVQSLEVWGSNGQVRLDAGVLFLAKFRSGWKVTAAGCAPRAEMPYDCAVEG